MLHNLDMLQKFLDAGAYTVAGNVIYPDPKRGHLAVAFWHNGGWQATPVGEKVLGELAQKPSADVKVTQKRHKATQDAAAKLANVLDEE